MFLTASFACTRELQTITGKVVDESGAALNDAAVTACYSGWGWSSGQLVWDKDFCSEPVLTNNEGFYVISFKGPNFIRLRAKKKGWIQTQDFNANDSRIILIQNKVYSARIVAEASLREITFRQRLSDESDVEYYCRVVISRNRPITLNYRGATLSIVPSLLLSDDQGVALFGMQGSAVAVSSFANEAMFRINGEMVNGNFSFKPGVKVCGPDIHFIGSTASGIHLETDKRIEIFIPSIRAMFDVQSWINTVKP